ncbi:ornithine carbamoyltransferase [Thermaerobacter marianensis DSM 12885]|uniref:Ornithine carbamoyltransferase n=1 Tax=Thermaerobacter marianensis (strain ATCC 700841 / DSM 12885 / JCM 10246 / 7p75a) TaxID=644966 RepID=E6SH28_THEM7|nr:ornithine carbamoyltransferase [Thermaerobacter marianensis]ADU50659.1 ornithine carbamoyltransferase [Thermaerobacter marianensis DSM 12885]
MDSWTQAGAGPLAVPAAGSPRPWPGLAGRDFLTLSDFTPDELAGLLDLAAALKQEGPVAPGAEPLYGKTLAMIFEKPSTRTRVSFEVGMQQLGGRVLNLSPRELQLSRGETLADTARVLSRYVDALMVRAYSHATVEELAEAASIPVINGLTDLYHPCQIMADLLTIREYKGRLRGVTVAYVGDSNNVAHTWLLGAALMGLHLRLACPPGYEPRPEVLALAKTLARDTGATVQVLHDPVAAVRGAEVVYTDVWTSMGQEGEEEERRQIFAPYQVNADLVAHAAPDFIFMHCMPAHRGEEVTGDVLDGPHSVVLDQAENRLHVQKAILLALLG